MHTRLLSVAAAALLTVACSDGPTERPAVDPVSFEAVLVASGQGSAAAAYLDRAPRELQLSAQQREAIRDINARFRAEHQADLDALTAIVREAVAAHRAGATPDALRAILEDSREIRERLAPAFLQLARALNAVLTDAQRAWLVENARRVGPPLPELPPRR